MPFILQKNAWVFYWFGHICVTCALQYCWIQPVETKRAPGPKLRAVRSTAKVKATTRMRTCTFFGFLKWQLKHRRAFLRENVLGKFFIKKIISFVIFEPLAEACHKRSSPRGPRSGVPHAQRSYSRACHVPWRAAARAGRERWGHCLK